MFRKNLWPSLFIVGVPRAGTTTLYEYLKRTPDIHMSPIKEPRYFIAKNESEDIFGRFAVGNTEKYLRLFVSNKPISGEATPHYLKEDIAEKIYNVAPTAKILITLRNPIDRLFSNYLKLKSIYNFSFTLSELLKYDDLSQLDIRMGKGAKAPSLVGEGFYYKGVKKYLELFTEKNVKIIIFEEWIKNVIQTINDILEFLGSEYKYKQKLDNISNPSLLYRNSLLSKLHTKINTSQLLIKILLNTPPIFSNTSRKIYYYVYEKFGDKPTEKIPLDIKHYLQEIYFDDVKNLEELLERSLPWKEFQ